ncbi:MAG: lysylphosphatidylglycerol synthase transmembrane domain-containing protein [Rhizobiaceae bacterium]
MLAILFFVVDFEDVFSRLSSASPVVFLGLAAIVFTTGIMAAFRWQLILDELKASLHSRQIVPLTLVAAFFHQVILPGSGEVLRVGFLRRQGHSVAIGLQSVVLDRGLGIIAIILLVLASVALAWGRIVGEGAGLVLLLIVPTAGMLALFLMDFLERLGVRINSTLFGDSRVGVLVGKLIAFVAELSRSSRRLMFRGWRGPMSLAISIGIQLAHGLVLYCCARMVAMEVSLADVLLVLPPALLIAAMPITIGGWGVREGALSGGLVLIGYPSDGALSLAVLYGAILTVGGVMCALGWLGLDTHPAELEAIGSGEADQVD